MKEPINVTVVCAKCTYMVWLGKKEDAPIEGEWICDECRKELDSPKRLLEDWEYEDDEDDYGTYECGCCKCCGCDGHEDDDDFDEDDDDYDPEEASELMGTFLEQGDK